MNSFELHLRGSSALLLFAFLTTILPSSRADENIIYKSGLSDKGSLLSPEVGPPGERGDDGWPEFVDGGITAIDRGNDSGGSFIFPATGWPTKAGTLSFWLSLRGNWTVPAETMPLLMGEKDCFQIGFDMRASCQKLYVYLEGAKLAASVADWKAGEKHHVGIAWSEGQIHLYIDGVLADEGSCEPFTPQVFHVNSFGASQANYMTVISDLMIERCARAEFPETGKSKP